MLIKINKYTSNTPVVRYLQDTSKYHGWHIVGYLYKACMSIGHFLAQHQKIFVGQFNYNMTLFRRESVLVIVFDTVYVYAMPYSRRRML
jgi:hypothetical protein